MKKTKYEEVAENLLRKINAGAYRGGKLPSMSAIAGEYGVNLQTANRAVKFLEQRGIVSCFTGKKGTVINAARAKLTAGDGIFAANQVFGGRMRTRIRFVHNYLNGKMQDCFQECVRRFTRQYPWTEVEIFPVDTLGRIESGEFPCDTVLLSGRDVRSLARRGKLRDLNGYPRLAGTDESEFCPGLWSSCRWEGVLYAVPFSWSVPLKGERGGQSVFSWREPEPVNESGLFSIGFYSLLCLFLGEPFSGGFFRDKEKGLHELLEFIRKLCVSPDGKLTFWDDPGALRNFDAEKGRFLCGYYSTINTMIGQRKNWRYAPLPPYPGGRNIMATECLAVSAGTGALPESLLWLKFLQSPEAQRVFMASPSFLPARRALLREMPAELVSTLEKAAENAVQPQLSSNGLYRLYSCVYPLLERYFSGEIREKQVIPRILELLREEIVLDDLQESSPIWQRQK